jgi:peroxin-26
VFSSFNMDFRDVVDRANMCLLFRQFEECLNICRENVAKAKNYIEDERACTAVESLVVIAIQAYAELNRWLEVVPFVAQTYNGLEECPPVVARLCLLLHAKLKDDVTCTVIASIWLKNPSNYPLADYRTLAETYITHVLVPAQRWDDVRSFLDSCPGLDEASRQSCLRQVSSYRRHCEELAAERIEVLESAEDVSNDVAVESTSDSGWKGYLPYNCLITFYGTIKYWTQTTVAPFVSLVFIRNVCILTVLFYFLISRWKQGYLKSAIIQRIWLMLVKLWRGMFGPLYMIGN